jgi:hypothetical protein
MSRLFDSPAKDTVHPAGMGGEQRIYKFDNGFGASVIRSSFSYGGRDGLWELGVLNPKGHLTYDTPITSDVEGWLDEDAVEALLQRISAL